MPSGRAASLVAAALFLAFVFLYLFTLSKNYSLDGLSFARLITEGDLGQPLFFQAEHLLFPLAGWFWFSVWQLLGYDQGALLPLQVLNALLGALGVALFYLALRSLMTRRAGLPAPAIGTSGTAWFALPPALALGVSFAYWFHSTGAEDQIASNAFLLASFLALTWARHRSTGSWLVLAGVSLALAILLHATQVLFLPAALLALGLWRRSWKPAALLVALSGLLVALPYALVGWLALGLRAPGGYLAWFLSAPSHGIWGRAGWGSLWQGMKTLGASVASLGEGPNFRTIASGNLDLTNVLRVLLFLALLLGFALALAWGMRAAHRDSSITAVALVWLLSYGLFALYWAPEDIQFWIATLPPLLLLSTQAWLGLPRLALVGAGFIPVLLLAYNLTAMVPRSDLASNRDYARASCLATFTSQQDLIITPGWDWASAYLPYFYQRQVFSLVDNYLLAAGRDKTRLLAILEERMAVARARGGQVLILDGQNRWLAQVTGLTTREFAPSTRPMGECLGEPLRVVLP
jgi:hypothetical protein